MMALQGYSISGDVYAWSAVFLLPVNSALNPILYTVTAILGKKVKQLKYKDGLTNTNLTYQLEHMFWYYTQISRRYSLSYYDFSEKKT